MPYRNGRMNQQNDDMPQRNVVERKSKSQVKRDMKALQKVGERLVELSPNQLEKIALPDELREAIQFATTLKKREAWRRHIKYIGALMRDVDTDPIIAELEDIEQGQRREAQRLMQLARNARKEQELNKPPKAARALFRYLRELNDRGENKINDF
jgi:ribosome-associated protein